METLFTTKQVARALGVSESSLKRWCDQGRLAARRTVGGHRRLPLYSVVSFLRDSGQPLLKPEALGLPPAGRAVASGGLPPQEQLSQGLLSGDELACRRIVLDQYLQGRPAHEICDNILTPALWTIGELWEAGRVEVFEERRSCEICLRLIFELRNLLPAPEDDAPLAIGATPSHDQFKVPTAMVELALREAGWRAESFGADLPLSTLRRAIETARPRLFWLSVTHLNDEAEFLAEYEEFYQFASSRQVAMVVGGRALTKQVRARMKYGAYCDHLDHLLQFATTLYKAPDRPQVMVAANENDD